MKQTIALILATASIILSILCAVDAEINKTTPTPCGQESISDIDVSNCKIQKGTYTGHAFEPITLTFDFTPVMLIVENPTPRADSNPGWFDGFVWTGEASVRATSSTYPEYDDAEFYFTTNGKSITFTVGGYQPGGDYYLNEDGIEYSYIAIGY